MCVGTVARVGEDGREVSIVVWGKRAEGGDGGRAGVWG